MKVTEMLVTGYNGDEPVFVVNLAEETAATVLTEAGADGQTEVGSTSEQATQVFESVRELLGRLNVIG